MATRSSRPTPNPFNASMVRPTWSRRPSYVSGRTPAAAIATAAAPPTSAGFLRAGRWGQLFLGIVCMTMIANLQYGWTLFVDPLDAKYHWGRAAIQMAFTIFVLTETWLVPVEGYLVDRYGPRP